MDNEIESEGPFQLAFFKENDFHRKQCISCKNFFWTQSSDRVTCGDPPCDSYGFIGNPAGKGPLSPDQVRTEFINYFSKDHRYIKPYPVVPRWRDDVLLVNASIYDFQPHVTSGLVPPPGNPLVMSQPSIRMNDLDLVGVSGRHLTCFEMLCHDSFNNSRESHYWKEGTVSRCDGFLSEVVGIKRGEISYKEKPWSGGGNAGDALEVFVRGLEVGTLVFMDLREDPEGSIEIEGSTYSKMEMNIVDTGYGLERISWVTQGSPTVYDSTYGSVISHILTRSGVEMENISEMGAITQIYSSDPDRLPSEIEKEVRKVVRDDLSFSWDHVEKIRQAYVLGDHARSILLLSRDYVIPSNVKVGYLFRLLLRRSFRAIDHLHFKGSLMEIIKLQASNMKGIVDDFPEQFLQEIIDEERDKYEKSLEKGIEIVKRILKKKGAMDFSDLEMLYDSHGLVPDFVSQIMKEQGKELIIPPDFHARIVERHTGKEKIIKAKEEVSIFRGLETRPLYYDDPNMLEFTCIILDSSDDLIVTNQTAFYPTGGGQPFDTGYFQVGSKKYSVIDVYKDGNAVVHKIVGHIEKGTRVKGYVDGTRRKQLMVHHTSTHLLLGTLRKLLGEQVWQAGAQKGVESSRIDITYNGKITDETIRLIEHECLARITENRKVTSRFMDWNKAIETYGFRLFEGGVPLSGKLRVVEIEGVDVEGCGGTHLSGTGEIGFLKILKVESIQEGIYRFTFAAGNAALNYVESIESDLTRIKTLVRSTEDTVQKVEKSIEELIRLREEITVANKEILTHLFDSARKLVLCGTNAWIVDLEKDELLKLAVPIALSKPDYFILSTKEKKTVVGRNKEELQKIVKCISKVEWDGKGQVIPIGLNQLKSENLIN